ncbi:hypothetical protein PX701_11705 [Agromyces sp. H3Y2-19a]|uniref:hypothetical protein n=1 Tax=Agromyces chromiiresistens TaxID=3030835 RepID=UPI0023B9A843|nr:hypothetical protein [Agromyces chromiiresistens]MDF0514288.1 hypothetical protein [Agromyces chromiiresistens]
MWTLVAERLAESTTGVAQEATREPVPPLATERRERGPMRIEGNVSSPVASVASPTQEAGSMRSAAA